MIADSPTTNASTVAPKIVVPGPTGCSAGRAPITMSRMPTATRSRNPTRVAIASELWSSLWPKRAKLTIQAPHGPPSAAKMISSIPRTAQPCLGDSFSSVSGLTFRALQCEHSTHGCRLSAASSNGRRHALHTRRSDTKTPRDKSLLHVLARWLLGGPRCRRLNRHWLDGRRSGGRLDFFEMRAGAQAERVHAGRTG